VPGRAYLSLWIQKFDETNMLSNFEKFLTSVPLTTVPPTFTELVIRAVDPTEPPLAEYDLRAQEITPADITELVREHQAADISCEVAARWDLWSLDLETGKWARKPQRLFLYCHGPQYDNGVCTESGHLMAELGFEDIFTGQAGLLMAREANPSGLDDPFENSLVILMSQPSGMREYQEKTRQNIQTLMAWVRAAEDALPIERIRLWSEGEENFEAKLDDILAAS
jgi:hypothetical protein